MFSSFLVVFALFSAAFGIPAECPYSHSGDITDVLRIPMDQFGEPSDPWSIPFSTGSVGRCLSWNAQNELETLQDMLDKSVCEKVTVGATSKYAFQISTFETHRDVRHTEFSALFAENPEAVIRLFDGDTLMQTIEYRGNDFQTNDALQSGKTYEICVAARRTSFTMCTMNIVACNNADLSQCGFLSPLERRSARRFSDRDCSA